MDIREVSVALSLIREINSDQFFKRRRAEYKAYKVSEGGQLSFVMEKLSELFPKSYKKMRVSDISLSNKIISKLAVSYKESPVRNLGVQTDLLNEILSESDFDSVMEEFDRDFVRQKYGLLWVSESEGRPKFHSLKGFGSFVKIDQITGHVVAVVINYPSKNITSSSGFGNGDGVEQELSESQDDTSAESQTYAMWTNNFHSVWRVEKSEDGERIVSVGVKGNESGINPLGILPFVYKSKNSSVDLPFLNQITEQSIMYNLLKSDELSGMALQSYGQLVVSLPEGVSIETMNGGMTTAITLPIIEDATTQADAKYINANPDLSGMKNTVDGFASDVVSEHMGTSGGISGEKFSSGLERIIASVDVTNKVSSNQKTYAKIERRVVEILRAYDFIKDSNDNLVTIFPKPKVMISDKETLENIDKRIKLGLLDKPGAMQVLDPNLDRKEAEEAVKKIEDGEIVKVESFLGMGNKDNLNNGGQGNEQIKA